MRTNKTARALTLAMLAALAGRSAASEPDGSKRKLVCHCGNCASCARSIAAAQAKRERRKAQRTVMEIDHAS